MKRLLIGVAIAAFALAAATDVSFAHAKKMSKAKPAAMSMTDVNKVPNCGKGKAPLWTMMGAKPHWKCVKGA